MPELDPLCVHCAFPKSDHPIRKGWAPHHDTGIMVEAMVRTSTRSGRCPGWEDPPDYTHPAALVPLIGLGTLGISAPMLWDLPGWENTFGWRNLLGWLQVRIEGRCGEPTWRGLYGGVHTGYGGNWGSVHYRDSNDLTAPWREDDGTDGCGVDIGRGCSYDNLVEVFNLTADEIAWATDQVIFEHTYRSHGNDSYYAPHDHCSTHGSNVHVHVGILPDVQLPALGPVTPPVNPDPDQIGGRPVQVLSGSIGFGQFRALHTGHALDVGGDGGDGAPLITYTPHYGMNQQFSFRPSWRVAEGYLNILGRSKGRVWDVAGAQIAPGSPLIMWETHDGVNQMFMAYLLPASAGFTATLAEGKQDFEFRDLIKPTLEELQLIMDGTRPARLTTVNYGPPLFVFVSALTTPEQFAESKPMVLDIDAGGLNPGASAQIFPLHGGPNQIFALS